MDKSDSERFNNLMQGMADNFRDTISKEGLRLRFEILKPYSIEQIERAGLEIIRTRKYTKMPPVAVFIEVIEGVQPAVETKADQQWNHLMREVAAKGWYGTPDISDPITRQLMNGRFSLATLCDATTRELSFIRRDFVAAYIAEEAFLDIKLIPEGTLCSDLEQIVGNLFESV